MLALIQSLSQTDDIVIVSAETDDRLKDQIKRVVNNELSASAWYTIMDERETADLGKYQITVFDTNSILTVKLVLSNRVIVDIQRDVHNLTNRG